MAGMFDELYQDPYDAIRDRNIAVGRLDDWGAMAADVGSMAGMLGRAGSKALGATYEEDLVEDILLKGQHDTPEGQAATLKALAQVSPGAFMKVQKMYEDMNLSKAKLEEQQIDIDIKKDKLSKQQATPRLEKEYDNNQMTTDIINWMKMNTSDINEEDIASIITTGNAQDLLFKRYAGKSGAKWKELKAHIKQQKEAYVDDRYKGKDDIPPATTVVGDEVFAPRVVPGDTTVFTPFDTANDDSIGGA